MNLRETYSTSALGGALTSFFKGAVGGVKSSNTFILSALSYSFLSLSQLLTNTLSCAAVASLGRSLAMLPANVLRGTHNPCCAYSFTNSFNNKNKIMRKNYFLTALLLLVSFVLPQKLLAGTTVTETYSFQSWATTIAADTKFTFDTSNELKVGDDNSGASVYTITNTFNGNPLRGRFASTNTQSTYLRYKSGKPANTGIFVNTGSSSYFSIRNLKDGDKVKITSASCSKIYFASSNVTDEVVVSSSFSADKKNNVTVDDGATTLTSEKEYTISTTGKSDHLDFWMAGYSQITAIEITTTVDNETVDKPIISITGANKGERTISISSTNGTLGNAPTVYYTTDGTEPTKANGTAYTGAFTISETSTIKAISYISDDVVSEVASLDVEAGTTVKLADVTSYIATMEQDGDNYFAKYTFSTDNSATIGAPTATLSATFNGNAVTLTDNSYTPKEAGTLTVTSTAEGYDAATTSVECKGAYSLLKTIDIKGLTSDDINTEYWTKNDNATTSSQWNFSNVENYSLKSNDYVKQGIDGLTLFTTGDLAKIYIGYGLQQPSTKINYCNVSVTNGMEGQLVKWNYMNGYNSSIVHKVQKGNEAFSLYRFSWMITSVDIYTQAKDVTKTISASKFASFSAAGNTEVPEGVSVYTAKVDGSNVVLTKVETSVIPANTGVIIGSETEGEKTFKVTLNGSDADFSANELIATSVEANATVPTTGTYYALSATEAKFGVLTGGIKLSANKAYLAAPADEAKQTSLNIVFGGETTGISEAAAAKAIDNGAFYTLQGVRVAKPAKGLYIHNGKKVLVK